jgi:hypothetical protein
MFALTSNPRTVSGFDFPTTGTPAAQLRFLLNYAVLAPSEYNTQPWLFKVSKRVVELYADRSRRLPIVDPEDRELTISCGAAFFNLRIALRHFGYTYEIEIHANQDSPDLLARISLGKKEAATEEEHQLFYAIPQRRSNRHVFEKQEVPADLLSALNDLAGQEGTWFRVVQGEEARQTLVNLVANGDHMQWTSRQFRRELARWTRPEGIESHDGLPGYTQVKGTFASSISPQIVRTFDMGNGVAARDRQLVTGSPVLAVLGTFDDTWSDWFTAGQAVEKILLRASAEGVSGSFLNQPIEILSLRTKMREVLGQIGFPQLVIRLGYGPQVPPTPRRSVSEVLIE